MYLNNSFSCSKSQTEILFNLKKDLLLQNINLFLSKSYAKPIRHSLLNFIFKLHNSYSNNIIFSQENLAEKIGCSRETLVRLTKELHKLNIVVKINRGVKKACFYVVNDLFCNFTVRKILVSIFSNLKWFHKSILYAKDKLTNRNVTQKNYVFKKNIKNKYINYKINKKSSNFKNESKFMYQKEKERQEIAQEAKETYENGLIAIQKTNELLEKQKEKRRLVESETQEQRDLAKKKIQSLSFSNPKASFFADIVSSFL